MNQLSLIAVFFILIKTTLLAQKPFVMVNQNNLNLEHSPYLKQHENNPVNWQTWSPELIKYAQSENKLVLISIGYSACHWCHVMEHESFEDPEVAAVMNKHFINIKVDREERPDLDQIYMDAVQTMSGQGGWPLNCIALPDGRPIWGGTYFKKNDWIKILEDVAQVYQSHPEKVLEYGGKLSQVLSEENNNLNSKNNQIPELKTVFDRWEIYFDDKWGGSLKAPKFPLPNNIECLMRFAFHTKNKTINQHVTNTLNKMAMGGIYDHINGGFFRYAVDEKWHIPHFEKMLYDNAQLISLYAKAYKNYKNPMYKEIVEESINFVCSDLYHLKHGAFLSSLDADSPNKNNKKEEGAYYVWTKEELKEQLDPSLYRIFKRYYNINEIGYWENGKYHLFKTIEDEKFCEENQFSKSELKKFKTYWRKQLKKTIKKRKAPGLDHKIITSWNALMLSGLIDSYDAFKNERHLNYALKNAYFIKQNLIDQTGKLYHTLTKDKPYISGFLEDYALSIEAFIKLYQITFDEQWIQIAYDLTARVFEDFKSEEALFYFTDGKDKSLFKRKIEINDNVITSSNSVMAKNLFYLGKMFLKQDWVNHSKAMLFQVASDFDKYPPGYSNWLQLAMNLEGSFYEIGITGTNTNHVKEKFSKLYLPNVLFIGALQKSSLSILKHRFKKDETWIYICEDQHCNKPTQSIEEAKSQIKTHW